MIHVNLLPPEYRKSESTPIARFLAIVIGATMVTSGLVAYGFIHYSKLKSVRDVREATEAEYKNKQARANISKALANEIAAYEARRKAIQNVAASRILWSRKLDEFFDIIQNGQEKGTYFIWLTGLKVAPPRSVGRGKVTSGGTFSFSGWSESDEFSKVTNLRDAIRKDPFFDDFQGISQPVFEAKYWNDGLEPSVAGKFNYELTLKPLVGTKSRKRK